MQFNFAYGSPLKVVTPSTEGSGSATTPSVPRDSINTIEVNTTGVKISSSVIGLIILTLSIVFAFQTGLRRCTQKWSAGAHAKRKLE
jgi:hypothetical protein